MCDRRGVFGDIRLPSTRADALAVNETLQRAVRQSPSGSVRVWAMITFGFELPMLLLHMQTLEGAVEGFIVSESLHSFQTKHRKRLVLTEALANGSVVPSGLARKISVRVVSLSEAQASCGGWRRDFSACFEARQRVATLELLFAKARRHDLALIADVDEIARPEVVAALARCRPFSEAVGTWALEAKEYVFGVHCSTGYMWRRGPLAASVASLQRLSTTAQDEARKRGAAAPDMFLLDALRNAGLRRIPRIARGGWHLTSFGSPASVRRKFRTWGHAATFANVPGALAEDRLERCARHCLRADPVVPRGVGRGRPVRLVSPSCQGRADPTARPLPGRVLGAHDVATADLPPYLLANRRAFADFFRYVQ